MEHINQLTASYSIKQFFSSQEIPLLLWSLTIHYRVHKNHPLVPILSQTNPVHTFPQYVPKIHFNIIHPTTRKSYSDLFATNILHALRISPMHATCLLIFYWVKTYVT